MSWQFVQINTFLKERKERFKPHEANSIGLKRIEKIDFTGIFHIVDHKQTNTNMILIKKGDLVISGINVEKGALGIYEGEEDVLATIHYSSYQYNKELINIDYLKWFLKSLTFQNILKEQVGGGIKTELKPKKFLPLKIHLPDIYTQQQIVLNIKKVDEEINEVIEINRNNTKLISLLYKSILQEAIQGRLVPHDNDDKPASKIIKKVEKIRTKLIAEKNIKKPKPYISIKDSYALFEVPKSWQWIRLGELLVFGPRNGYSPKPCNRITSVKTLSLSATTSGTFDPTYYKFVDKEIDPASHLWLKNGDILIQRGNSLEYVGTSAVYNGSINEFIYPDLMIKLQVPDFIDPMYINLAINSNSSREYFMKNASGTSGTMPKINQSIVNSLPIPLPPYNEQKRIVAKVDELMQILDDLVSRLRQSQKDSEMLMQVVLQEAVG